MCQPTLQCCSMLSDYKRSEGGLDWHESWRFVNFPLSIYKKTKIPITCQTLWRSLKWNYLQVSMIYSSSGKRRALVPPSVGYTSENLKPIPDEVCGFCSFLSWNLDINLHFIYHYCEIGIWIICIWVLFSYFFLLDSSLDLDGLFYPMQKSLWYLKCSFWRFFDLPKLKPFALSQISKR